MKKIYVKLSASLLFMLFFFSSVSRIDAQENKNQPKKNKDIILLEEATLPDFDGSVDIDKEWANIKPIKFPGANKKFIEAYIKQCGGVLFLGFKVPGRFLKENSVRIGLAKNINLIHTFLYNPLNPSIKPQNRYWLPHTQTGSPEWHPAATFVKIQATLPFRDLRRQS